MMQMGFVLGIGLTLLVGVGLYFGAGIFSRDVNVLHLIRIGLPVIYINIYKHRALIVLFFFVIILFIN